MDIIRIGVVGVGRGQSFARGAGPHVGMELVALCDTWEERLQAVGKELDVVTYTDYDRFLEHDMDAVILANFFHEHAPFAVKALESGRHVMSETAACHTLGEAVALVRAVEASGLTYMLAENYPYMRFNQEMRRLFQSGEMGEFKYGEGEYVHPDGARTKLARSCGRNHWRNWIPATYYCTHSVGPVMYITDTWPTQASGFVVPHDPNDESQRYHMRVSDTAACIMLRMDNGAVAKSLHGALRGHQNFVRIHCTNGLMENARIGDRNQLRVCMEPHGKEQATREEKVYVPDWPEYGELAAQAGHGGGDFWTCFHFANAVRSGEPPYLDVYRGVAMSVVGIQAWRSALQGGAPVAIPDFRDAAVCAQFEHDDWSPDPARRKPGQPPCSILGELRPSPEAEAFAKEVWASRGYEGE